MDVELDSVTDLVVPVLDTEDGPFEWAADAVGYVPVEGVSSVGEAAQRDPYGVGSLGQRASDHSVDRAASSLGDVDMRARVAIAGSSTSSFVVVSPELRVDSAASSLSDPDVRAWAASDHSIVDV